MDAFRKFEMVLACLACMLFVGKDRCCTHAISIVHTGPLLSLVELKRGTPNFRKRRERMRKEIVGEWEG